MHLQTFIVNVLSRMPCFDYSTLLPQSTHKMEGKLKILEINQKSEEIIHIYLVFCAFRGFYCDIVKRKCPCLVGVY